MDPLHEYSARLSRRQATVDSWHRRHLRIGNAKVFCVALFLLFAWMAYSRHFFPAHWLWLPVVLFLALLVVHELVLRAKARAESSAGYFRRAIARVNDQWAGSGQTGERFRSPGHVYADDLDLFGPGSLFELLCTARLPMGERRLADWLRFPAPLPAILERHVLISELREMLDLREQLAVSGESLRSRLDPERLVSWAESPHALPTGAYRGVAAFLSLAVAGGVVAYFLLGVLWPLFLVLAAELLVRWRFLKRAEGLLGDFSSNAEGLLLLSKILAEIEQQRFSSPGLQARVAALRATGHAASQAVRRLARIVYWVDGRHSLLAHLIELPLLYTLQVAFAAESWRRQFGRDLPAWVELVAEFEALLSLASYSFEHPADPWPEFIATPDGSALLEGDSLGHPLIPAARCVPNSVRLDSQVRLVLVSGSNMSGKSTYLRTVGVNVVLAMAGAPIRGKSLRLTPLQTGTCIRRSDSLQEGHSGFYTEVLRIRRIFELTAGPEPLLFLFDELLEGTNSNDRRTGAEGLSRALLDRRAIGIVTTHDLALTEIAPSLGGHLRNMHFEDRLVDGAMRFDYQLREGVVTRSNAIALMRLVGFEL